jgi:hypothetical protein
MYLLTDTHDFGIEWTILSIPKPSIPIPILGIELDSDSTPGIELDSLMLDSDSSGIPLDSTIPRFRFRNCPALKFVMFSNHFSP